MATGLSNREIGGELSVSEHTAANHIRSILRKTDCANRTEAASFACRHSGSDRHRQLPQPRRLRAHLGRSRARRDRMEQLTKMLRLVWTKVPALEEESEMRQEEACEPGMKAIIGLVAFEAPEPVEPDDPEDPPPAKKKRKRREPKRSTESG